MMFLSKNVLLVGLITFLSYCFQMYHLEPFMLYLYRSLCLSFKCKQKLFNSVLKYLRTCILEFYMYHTYDNISGVIVWIYIVLLPT